MHPRLVSLLAFSKPILKEVIAGLPAKSTILSVAARFPVQLRFRHSLRLFTYLASSMRTTVELQSNLGFSKHRYTFPSDRSFELFGKPEFYTGERGSLELCKSLTQYADAFIDIGAHVGYFSFYVRECLERSKPIFLFEPDLDLFKLIETNISIAGLPNMRAFRKAVGNVDGQVTFYKNPEHPDMGSITNAYAHVHTTIAIPVEATRFDTFVSAHQLQNMCVKVDVENAEEDFLLGAESAVESINYLIIEVLSAAHQNRFVQKMISKYKFYAYYINDYSLEYSPNGNFDYVSPQYNWLFCREKPEELRARLGKSRLRVIIQ